MEKRLVNTIKGIAYDKMRIDENLEWLRYSASHGLSEESNNNVIRFLLREVGRLSEEVKGLKDFYYGFEVVTEPNKELGLPKIGWEKGDFSFKEDSHQHYSMNGYSEDGREWRAGAIYCLDDMVQWPLEDGDFEEVK